jgi:hypothetical protein
MKTEIEELREIIEMQQRHIRELTDLSVRMLMELRRVKDLAGVDKPENPC